MKIFVAIAQYKVMPRDQILEIARKIGLREFKAYSMEFHPMFENALVETIEQNPQHQFRFHTITGGTADRSRSMLFGVWKKLLDEGDACDYFWILDDDLSFPPDAIEKLIQADKSVICAAYSYKTDKGPKGNMPVMKFEKGERVHPDGSLKIKRVNGGFVLLRRDVLTGMIEAYPELYWEHFQNAEGDDFDIPGSWALWIPEVRRDFGIREYLSEDYAFSERARRIGYDIWCHTQIPVLHWNGAVPYGVNWARVIKKERSGRPIDNDIDGWTTELELEWLEDHAKEMGSVVEIGSWKGRSTKALLDGCKGPVYAVDHFKGNPSGAQFSTPERAEREKIFDQFMANVGSYPNLQVMKMRSAEAVLQFEGQADMIFIDGDHSYEAVKRDIESWLPRCRRLICGHDYNETGVWRAVHDVLGKVTGIYESIWYKKI